MEEYVFVPLSLDVYSIQKLSKEIYITNIKARNYEGAAYALYFSVKYKFKLELVEFDVIKRSGDCILLLIHYLYDKMILAGKEKQLHKDLAEEIKNRGDMNRFCLYVYEVLNVNKLSKDWKALKKEGITFIKDFR